MTKGVFNYHGVWFYDDEKPTWLKVFVRRLIRGFKR
jgi:hypothetical protein